MVSVPSALAACSRSGMIHDGVWAAAGERQNARPKRLKRPARKDEVRLPVTMPSLAIARVYAAFTAIDALRRKIMRSPGARQPA